MASDGYQSSIRLRRMPSDLNIRTTQLSDGTEIDVNTGQPTRRRSRSEPQRPRLGSLTQHGSARQSAYMPTLEETSPTTPGAAGPSNQFPNITGVSEHDFSNQDHLQVPAPVHHNDKPLPQAPNSPSRAGRRRAVSNVSNDEYDSNLVDLLDLVDPEIATLSTLTNVQNSLFVPNLGRLLNRRPTYNLTQRDPTEWDDGKSSAEEPPKSPDPAVMPALDRTSTLASITSRQTERHYAVLPHGILLEGWSAEDRQELDDHVRHFLHSRRSKFKRSMKGFGQYVKRPLGFFVTLYATLITLFGLAWVLFLIGWINVGGRQLYIINIIDNVLVALFAIMGDGLAPFRAVDTYHMIYIAHYHHYTWSVRKKKALPKLPDENDLPPLQQPGRDVEAQTETQDDQFDKAEESVLTPEQQKKLDHHQKKFSRSHTFYKPHETTTHHAFPLRLLVAIVVLLDCHSCLQLALGLCTWILNDYRTRPFALTTVILCVSITVNITAGVLISVGDHKTRKKDVLEKMHRQELTQEAMEKLERRRERERERNEELNEEVPPALGHRVSEDVRRELIKVETLKAKKEENKTFKDKALENLPA